MSAQGPVVPYPWLFSQRPRACVRPAGQARPSAGDRKWRGTVTDSTDWVNGGRLQGPALHRITSPPAGAAHPAREPLTVTWAPAGASQAEIESEEMPRAPITDSGGYTVGGQYLDAEAGKTREDRVRVYRAEERPIDGALAGSIGVVRVRAEVSFTVDGGPES